MNIISEISSKEYLQRIAPSFLKWIKECLLCFEVADFSQLISTPDHLRKLVDLLSINSEMHDLTELVGLTSTTEILKEIFKIQDEALQVGRRITAGYTALHLGRIHRVFGTGRV